MALRTAAVLLASALALAGSDVEAWAKGLQRRGVAVSAGLWDAGSGKALERFQEGRALIPASTTKVVTTYALLKTLKPDFTLETEVWGDLKDGVVQGDLVFKGAGDPLLTNERLWMLARALKQQGIQRVQGSVRLDQSAFDAATAPQGWENTTADSLPTVLALSVNFNRDESGRQAKDPGRQAREVLTDLLREVGIAVEGRTGLSDAPRKLAGWTSPPLRALVGDINKWSNNFMIEMLVRVYGAGSWSRGVARIQDFYQGTFGLGPDVVKITDGSGLSKDNRLSAKTLATILRAAYHDFEAGPELVSSLKVIGGEPWRLKVKDENLARRVRVKTGHLDRVTSLAGFLQRPDGQVCIFAILLNGPAQDEDIWDLVSRWAN